MFLIINHHIIICIQIVHVLGNSRKINFNLPSNKLFFNIYMSLLMNLYILDMDTL